jgi:hypothetical protein
VTLADLLGDRQMKQQFRRVDAPGTEGRRH